MINFIESFDLNTNELIVFTVFLLGVGFIVRGYIFVLNYFVNKRRMRRAEAEAAAMRRREGVGNEPPRREEGADADGRQQHNNNNNNMDNNAHPPSNAPLLSPTATEAEVEAFAQRMRSSHARRRAAERHARRRTSASSAADGGIASSSSSACAADSSSSATGEGSPSLPLSSDDASGSDGPTEEGENDAQHQQQYECPVCLCEAEAAVEFLPCGHTFCAKCALQLWQHGGVLRQMQCPMDRSIVECIVPEYRMREDYHAQRRGRGEGGQGGEAVGEDENAAAVPPAPTLSPAEVRRLDFELSRYNTNNTRRTVLGMLRLATRAWNLAHFMPFLIRLKIYLFVGIAFIYAISPVDLIPEAVFGIFGYFDDFMVVLLCIVVLAGATRNALGVGGG